MWVSGLGLFPQFQFLKKGAVTFGFRAVKVVEKATPATDHGEKTTTGGEIFYGVFEVGREVVNAFREESDLDVGRTGVLFVEPISCDDLAFCLPSHKKKTLCKKDF